MAKFSSGNLRSDQARPDADYTARVPAHKPFSATAEITPTGDSCLRQKQVRSARDEHGQLLRDEHGHPILEEVYVDRGPRISRARFDDVMQHNWARVRHFESSPPTEDALQSSWPTPVPNRRRSKKVA